MNAPLSMLDVIKLHAGKLGPAPKPCPFCGTDPGLATQAMGRFMVGCDAEECPVQPQLWDMDLNRAWVTWNRRAP